MCVCVEGWGEVRWKGRKGEGQRIRGDTQSEAIGWPLSPELESYIAPVKRRIFLIRAGIWLLDRVLGIQVLE